MNAEYKKILEDLGAEIPEDEQLTDFHYRQIFIGMEEGLLIG
jgi:hypothetical protein